MAPPADTVYYQIVPGNRMDYQDGLLRDPYNVRVEATVCKRISQADSVFTPNCLLDTDGDGIPDEWDKCPTSPEGCDVDYCNEDLFGCSPCDAPP